MKKGYKYRLNVKQSDIKMLKDYMFSATQSYNIIHSLKENERKTNKKLKEEGKNPSYIKDSYIDNEITRILKQREIPLKNNINQQERRRYNEETSKRIKRIKKGDILGKSMNNF